jgi:hypothetical protein
MKRFIFWNVRSCNLLKVTESFGTSSSENSADIQRAIHIYLPEHGTLQILNCTPIFKLTLYVNLNVIFCVSTSMCVVYFMFSRKSICY